MENKHIKKVFQKDWEIPETVTDRMHQAYRELGADPESFATGGTPVRKAHRTGRYLKAASFLLAFLLVGATASAAAGGKFNFWSGLFQENGEVARNSSSTPAVTEVKHQNRNIDVDIEGISGTEELTYIFLRLKRLDGKTFDKNASYDFRRMKVTGENDLSLASGDQEENQQGTKGRDSVFVEGDGDEGTKISSIAEVKESADEGETELHVTSTESSTMSGRVIENNGTDELRMAILCSYKRNNEGKISGENCTLSLGALVESPEQPEESKEPEETVISPGQTELAFLLDYGEAATIEKKVNAPLSFPLEGKKDKYLKLGRLKHLTLTPYNVTYIWTGPESSVLTEQNYWEQIYLEMEDGSKVGFPTKKDYDEAFDNSFIGSTAESTESSKKGIYRTESIQIFPTLIDVEHVKAIYFGNTRIEL